MNLSNLTREQQDVTRFMLRADQHCPRHPTLPPEETIKLRLDLIHEELAELQKGFGHQDLVEIYDALIDLIFVTIGTAVACGLDLGPGWREVQRSNLSKFIDGHKREDGKWIKGPSYSPPLLACIVAEQIKTPIYT